MNSTMMPQGPRRHGALPARAQTIRKAREEIDLCEKICGMVIGYTRERTSVASFGLTSTGRVVLLYDQALHSDDTQLFYSHSTHTVMNQKQSVAVVRFRVSGKPSTCRELRHISLFLFPMV